MTQLTSVQEAAFNAAGEAARDLGIELHVKYYANGTVSAFGDLEPGKARSPFISGGQQPTGAEAVAAFLAEREKKMAEPQLLYEPADVREAAAKIVEEVRNAPELNPLALDEIADRIARLPVKE